jgi:hypothetical protein
MIVPSQLALKAHTNFGFAASLATLDKLVDRFPLPAVSLPLVRLMSQGLRHIQLRH